MSFRIGDDGCSIEGDWANDERRFFLGVGQLIALEDALDSGMAQIYRRLSTLDWRLKDASETIRLALIGAGVEGRIARRIVEEHVTPGKIAVAAMLAQSILGAAMAGRGNLPGKDNAAAGAPETSNVSPLPSSTEAAPS